MKKNAINWFEIYVSDFNRARTFYQTILEEKLEESIHGPCHMGMFPCDCNCENGGIGGAIVKMEGYSGKPGGTMVYLNVEGQLDAVIARIPTAGGKIHQGRMSIAPHGFIAIFEDTEGNINGLHSMT